MEIKAGVKQTPHLHGFKNSGAKDQGLAITSQAEADGHKDCVSQLHGVIAWFEIRSQALALVIGKRMK
jgi:hypothetical protein